MEELNFRLATDSDIDRINGFYNSIYKRSRSKAEFDWEFNSSPAGKAIYVVAEHQGRIVGTQCVIPYYVISDSNEVHLSGKSEDTLVSPDYRGKNIFEKMYHLLIAACRENSIAFIWGFTYAVKPFIKLGFDTPFRSKMGLLVLKPLESAHYLSSLSPKNKAFDKFKILSLSVASWIKGKRSMISGLEKNEISFGRQSLNSANHNYLKYSPSFGLKLDDAFIDYRIENNPYNKRYKTCTYNMDGMPLISLTYTITGQNVGYIIHFHFSNLVSPQEIKKFLRSAIRDTDLGNCKIIRFWGFSHTKQNKEEIAILSAFGFTFINRGISFVWLPLNNSSYNADPLNFVLSRMSSQGTD